MSPANAYHAIRGELERYGAGLETKLEIVAANKMDLTGDDNAWRLFAKSIGTSVLPISAVTGKGMGELLEVLWNSVQEAKATTPDEAGGGSADPSGDPRRADES